MLNILHKNIYNDNPKFADNISEPYKSFEIKYNNLLKEKYPSFIDEMKRQLWISNKIVIRNNNIKNIKKSLDRLIYGNFENGELIDQKNRHLIKYLIEKKTDKIYKILNFDEYEYYYSTLGEKTILSIKFNIKKKKISNKIIIKYSQGYFAEKAFVFSTYSETMQRNNAKVRFYAQFEIVKNKILNVLKTEAI